jgi:uncharacterized membrane protein YkvA (DUF1232 family)
VAKAVPVLAGVYVVSPLDLIPDALPILGQLDDLGVLLLALRLFLRLCPGEAVRFHQGALAQGRPYTATLK